MNVEKDFREYWKPLLEAHGVDTRGVDEYVKVLLHEYLFLQRQALPVYIAVTDGANGNLSWCAQPIIECFREKYVTKPN